MEKEEYMSLNREEAYHSYINWLCLILKERADGKLPRGMSITATLGAIERVIASPENSRYNIVKVTLDDNWG